MSGAAGSSDRPLEPGMVRQGELRTLNFGLLQKVLNEDTEADIPISEQDSEEQEDNLCPKCNKELLTSGHGSTDRCTCDKEAENDALGIPLLNITESEVSSNEKAEEE